jgi:phage host-nuclease inhibitor protein Gam
MKISSPRPSRNTIDMSNDVVARHWAKKLGKSKDEIVAAIEKVGDNCETVRKELGCAPDVGSSEQSEALSVIPTRTSNA